MNENALTKYQKYVRPELGKVLSALKLDNVYEQAAGDQMMTTLNGQHASVSDFLGGFGSTILGHNHPVVIEALKQCQEGKKPQHAQGSLKKETALLAEKLNHITKSKLNESRDYVVTFANSGTEAVEVALKHALLEWNEKRERTIFRIRTQFLRAKNVPEKVAKMIQVYCEKLENLSPVMISLEKSFHGKTSGAIALTANAAYKKMFQAAPVAVKFFSMDELASMLAFIEMSDTALEISPEMKVSFSPIVGFIYEPIQGEGGIEEIPQEFITSVSESLKPRGIPLICDEIQSGLFRTGKFLCSEWFGIKPDYILLGKSLGGGIAKISATMIARNHYVDEFGWIHTSTFSEDDWSSMIAGATVDFLLQNENEISSKAVSFEKRMRQEISLLQKKYPNVIKLVKGRGFFLGIEFNFDESAPLTDLLQGIYEQGHATYIYTSYLLHNHHVRVGVTLSAPEIIRLEPSAFVTAPSIDKLLFGLETLCDLLIKRKNLALTAHLWKQTFSPEQLETISTPKFSMQESEKSNVRHVGFLIHTISPVHAQSLDLAFKHVDPKELENFLNSYSNQVAPFRFFQQTIKGTNGQEVVVNFYGIMQPSSFFEESLRSQDMRAARLVQAAVDLAHSHGMKYLGLGQFTSIVSENGMLLHSPDMPLTTGNSLTAALAIEGIKKFASDKKIDLQKAKIGIVGYTGNICNVLTQIIADEASDLVLIHRENVQKSDDKKYQDAIDLLLSQTKLKKENLKVGHNLDELKACDIVIVGTNSSSEIIKSEHVKEGAIILDISIPSNVQKEVRKRSDVSYFQGGLAKLPLNQIIDHPWLTLKDGDCFACMSETIIMGLLGKDASYSMGRLNKPQVLESLKFAHEVGFSLGGLK